MKYSYNWLKELSRTKLSPEKMGDLLMMRAFEVDDIVAIETGFESIVIGEIKTIKKHPNADRLQLAKVDIGNKILDIVCGASNIQVGQKVPVALDGAVLLSGHTIREAEIRGKKSQGMLCSEQDLGIGEDHSGIMILPKNAKIGANFDEYLKLSDYQIQLDILPNRGHDALSHVGMAREICVLENKKLNYTFSKFAKTNSSNKLSVKIVAAKLCRRYIGVLIEGIEIGQSPNWMQSRLKVSGIRPINNIVDITNYVMLELGQPLHAFDLAKINNQGSRVSIVTRKAKKNEKLKLLDGNELSLNENNLLITDGKKPLALAGVMGGESSGIDNDTSQIVLESANFEPVNIRKTRVEYNLNTESSYRFERNIDPNLAEAAAARAVELIQKYGGKKVKVVATADVYPKRVKPWKIKLNLDYVTNLLGEKIPAAKIKGILKRLGMSIKSAAKHFVVEIPTTRIDLKSQEDLIEEIGRIYGYENIPAKAPMVELSAPSINENRIFEDKLRDAMIALGFSEVLNYSFYSAGDIDKCNLGFEGHFEVANPMNPDQQYMRTSLIPGILKNVQTNLKSFDEFSIFEIGRKFKQEGEKISESTCFAAAIVDNGEEDNLFFALKGKLQTLLEGTGIRNSKFEIQNSEDHKYWHPTRTARIISNGEKIGMMGEVNPLALKEYEITQRVAVFELDIAELIHLRASEKIFTSISKYPTVKRDISMFVSENASYEDIEKEIMKSGGNLVNNVDLFDAFEKEGKKSLALRIEIGSREKTLTSNEIDEVMNKIISKLERDLKVKVRK